MPIIQPGWIVKLSNNQLNTWVSVSSSLAQFANGNTTPQSLWNTNENMVLVFYEKDIRPKFEYQTFPLQYINYNFCTSSYRVFYISKEPFYGCALLERMNFHDPNSIGITKTYGPGNQPGTSVIFGGSFQITTSNW